MHPPPGESVLALLLAGGEGRRLRPLTDRRPKPVVSFGCTHRIIDFALANLAAAGIRSVYMPGPDFLLESLPVWRRHWNRCGGVLATLPPPSGRYAGTGDAVRSARGLIRSIAPDVVVVLPSDHVYGPVLPDLLEEHRGRRNLVTLALARVPGVEAAQLGVVSRTASGRLASYNEKPAPADLPGGDRCLVSTGIFLFETAALLEFLDNRTGPAPIDWDLAPDLFPQDEIAVVEINGYWRDVGTIGAWWRAHMDLLEVPSVKDREPGWPGPPPERGTGAIVDGSLRERVSRPVEGVRRSILADDVIVESGARIDECVLLSGVRVGAGARLRRVIVDGPNSVPPGFELDGTTGTTGPWITDPCGVTVVPAGLFPDV